MSVSNQDTIKTGQRLPFDQTHFYTRMHVDALQQAMCLIKGEPLKLWLYLNKNQDGYTFDLSQKALEAWGLKKDSYYTAKDKLIELGYLIPIEQGSHTYIFSEFPNKPIVNSENQKVSSEKPKGFSEIPKDFSENQKDSSEKPDRNIINIIENNNNIIDNGSAYAEPKEEYPTCTLAQAKMVVGGYKQLDNNLIQFNQNGKIFKCAT